MLIMSFDTIEKALEIPLLDPPELNSKRDEMREHQERPDVAPLSWSHMAKGKSPSRALGKPNFFVFRPFGSEINEPPKFDDCGRLPHERLVHNIRIVSTRCYCFRGTGASLFGFL